jgi:hypothetical protein
MPLPATRQPLPHVDRPKGQGPGVDARAHAQVDRVLWRGEPGHRKVRIQPMQHVRYTNLRDVSEIVTAPTHARQTHDDRTRQRPVPPREASGTVTEKVHPSAHAFIPAAVQPAIRTDRARLETHAAFGYPQPMLRNARRRAGLSAAMLREIAKT